MALEPFSQAAADRLLAEFPQLRSSVKPSQSQERFLIEHPSPHAELSLYISTEDDEITIGIDGWHTHIGVFEDLEKELTAAVDLIRLISNDELVVAVRTKDGQWAGSSVVNHGDTPIAATGEKVTLKHWTGITNP